MILGTSLGEERRHGAGEGKGKEKGGISCFFFFEASGHINSSDYLGKLDFLLYSFFFFNRLKHISNENREVSVAQ